MFTTPTGTPVANATPDTPVAPDNVVDVAATLRRVASALRAVHSECHGLDATAIQRGWTTYYAHLGLLSELLDDDALAELSTLLPTGATGSESSLRIAIGGLSAWAGGHLEYLETMAATSALLGQLEQAISAAVSKLDAERAELSDHSYHGLYV